MRKPLRVTLLLLTISILSSCSDDSYDHMVEAISSTRDNLTEATVVNGWTSGGRRVIQVKLKDPENYSYTFADMANQGFANFVPAYFLRANPKINDCVMVWIRSGKGNTNQGPKEHVWLIYTDRDLTPCTD